VILLTYLPRYKQLEKETNDNNALILIYSLLIQLLNMGSPEVQRPEYKFRGENAGTWYYALVLMACYAVGELGHFLVSTVSTPMAQDIEFGDKGCLTINATINSLVNSTNKCRELKSEEQCFGASYMNETYCEWNFAGSGLQYQLLAGPAFIAIFTVSGIILGLLGDLYNRVYILSCCVLLYSTMALLTGFSQEYWHLLVLRFLFAAGEAGCTPLTASIIADKFGANSRALAMSVFNWGIYFGFAMTYPFGSYVTQANILDQGWRMAYFFTGAPGIVFATIAFFTLKEPTRKSTSIRRQEKTDDSPHASQDESLIASTGEKTAEINNKREQTASAFTTLFRAFKALFCSSPTAVLLIGACVRHTASFCWAYNCKLYFDHYYPGTNIGLWMPICSIVGGSIGIAVGGIISDFVVSRHGISMRLWVLVASQAIAAPLAAMVLYLPPPYCFFLLIITYFFAEMWFGILFTVMSEVFPYKIRTTSIALFIFFMNNIASVAQLQVSFLKKAMPYRTALLLVYPGFYLLSSLFFLLTQTIVSWKARTKLERQDTENKIMVENNKNL